MHELAQLTGANVAASTDLTGAAALGGNWVLEDETGAIGVATIEATNWNGELGTPTTTIINSVQAFVLNGSATAVSSSLVRLTPDQGDEHGSAMSKVKIDLTQNFEFDYQIYLGASDGADGIAFVLQNSPPVRMRSEPTAADWASAD